MYTMRLPDSYTLYNELQSCGTLYGLSQKGGICELVGTLVTIFVERMPGKRKDCGHHIVVPPLW